MQSILLLRELFTHFVGVISQADDYEENVILCRTFQLVGIFKVAKRTFIWVKRDLENFSIR